MKFLGQALQKLKSEQTHKHTDTQRQAGITYLHDNSIFVNNENLVLY